GMLNRPFIRPLIRPTLRLRFAWLALCAVLLGAFAPSVLYALAVSRPILPVDVCSTHGGPAFAAAVALLSHDQDERSAHGAAAGHCGHCLMHGHGTHVGLDSAPPPALRLPFAPLRHARPIALAAPARRSALLAHA